MVAGQQRDPVATLDAHCQQSVGDGVRGLVKLCERQLTVIVDGRGAIGVAAGVERRDHADLTPTPDVQDHRGDVLRRLDLEGAGFEHLAGVVQFGRAAFGVLLDFRRCLQRKVS